MEGSLGTHPRPKGRVPNRPPHLPHPFPQELEEARRWEGARDVRPLDGNVRRWTGLLLPVRGERARGDVGVSGGCLGRMCRWGHGRDWGCLTG